MRPTKGDIFYQILDGRITQSYGFQNEDKHRFRLKIICFFLWIFIENAYIPCALYIRF